MKKQNKHQYILRLARVQFIMKFIPVVAIILLLASCSCQNVPDLLEFHGNTMGTTYTVKAVTPVAVCDDNIEQFKQQTSDGIEAVLKRVNQEMSTYIRNSEISRFNRYRKDDWFSVSQQTAFVIQMALMVSEKSGGAFDITAGPLINLWGFGAEKRKREIPPQEEIDAVKTKIGYQKLLVRDKPPALKKTDPELYCDLSSIAKGFGVDQVVEYLETQGFENYLVEIGGEVRTGGFAVKKKPWRVGISVPDSTFSIQKIVELKDAAMATSGDYHNYFEKDGVRFSHTIDPNTGRPITHNLASVTVVYQSCVMADALATALDVMGPEKGFQLAVKEDLAVFFLVREKDGFKEMMSPRFQELLKGVSRIP